MEASLIPNIHDFDFEESMSSQRKTTRTQGKLANSAQTAEVRLHELCNTCAAQTQMFKKTKATYDISYSATKLTST